MRPIRYLLRLAPLIFLVGCASDHLCDGSCARYATEQRELEKLQGEWTLANPGKFYSGRARIEGRDFYLRYRESEHSEPVEIERPIFSIRYNHILFGPDDVGMGYLLSEEDGRERLHLEVRSSQYGNRELPLQRK